MFPVETKPASHFRIALLMLIVLSSVLLVGSESLRMPVRDSRVLQPLSGIHRTYWLTGGTSQNWNGTKSSPGPLIIASEGDQVTIMLQSSDGITHDWFLDFNNNFQLGPIHSTDFGPSPAWTNFTFTAVLNKTSSFPHGGTFIYRCEYHPLQMFGNFEFFAGPVSSFVYSPITPLAGRVVSFNGSTSWPSTGAMITTYAWDFGDGNVKSSPFANFTHTYSAAGTYVVLLNVTDSASQHAGSSKTITVNKPPPVPFDYSVSISPNKINIAQGQKDTVVLGMILVSGTPENVTLSSVISPFTSSIQVSLNRTSGFPSFSAELSIATYSSSPVGTYNITILAVSSSGVAHNATLTIVLVPNPPPAQQFNYAFWGTVSAVVIISGVAAIVLLRRSRTKRSFVML
jgi:PKD repeat protein